MIPQAMRVFVAAMSLAVSFTAPAQPQFPSKPVQLVVPYGPGPGDTMVRTAQSCLSTRFQQPVVVQNRPGANGEIGAQFVKTAAPDGHTLAFVTSGFVTDVATRRAPSFDIRQDLEPITLLVYGVQGIYVNAALPITTVRELIDYAKARPGALNYATVGIGSVNHLSTEALSLVADIRMVHVPFPGGTSQFLGALMGGDIQVVLTDISGAQAALDTGKIRLIAVLTRERLASRPGVPAVVETLPRMSEYLGTLWYSFFAPPRTPKDVMQRLHADLTGCINDPQVRAAFRKLGYEDSQISTSTPEELRTMVREQVARLQEIVRRANIQLRD